MKSWKTLVVCIILSWSCGWVALQAIDDSGRDLSLPPKPIPEAVELFLLAIPVTVAIAVSGNAHQPSETGMWIGLFLQWTAIGGILFVVVRRRSRSPAAPPHAPKA